MVIEDHCPNCQERVRRWVHIPFVLFRTTCQCGAALVIRNPKVSDEYVRTARRCLDCGDPILPAKPKGRVPKQPPVNVAPHPWVCESCKERHRVDEPGTDLDWEIKAWLQGHAPVSRTVSRRALAVGTTTIGLGTKRP
jgi:hypothetical protein